MEVHFIPAKGGGNTTATTLAVRSPNANSSLHANRSPHAIPASAQPHNTHPVNERSSIIHSQQYAYKPIAQPLNTFRASAHSHSLPSRRSPGSGRPPTPAPVQTVASPTDATCVDSVSIQVTQHPDVFMEEQQQPEEVATRALRGRPRKAPVQRKVECPQGLSPIPTGTQGGME